ncbi:MAG: glycosyltransferase family 8 protein [Endomicrobium sp.]|jgi:lipopolysaccharide biosynthesis glycosyltransferase|nr:glycosyltransferase family 8 protein [Endomicrobium sp.]
MNTKEINIAFCFDENFWTYASVTIISLLEVSKNQSNYNIYCIVSNTINNTIENILESNFKQYSSFSSIKFIKVANHLDNIKSTKKSLYYRLLLPSVLPNIDRIIYTDIDLIFNSDLQDLYSLDLTNNYVAAVKDACKSNEKNYLWQKYGIYPIAKNEHYINSGVLLLNLRKLKSDNMDKSWIQLAEKESFPFHDQDIINLTCKGKITFLPTEYNFSVDNAKIIHFAGSNKPWIFSKNNLKFTELWWFYAHKTPFVSFFLTNYYKPYYNSLTKVLPKWFGRFICWFILKKENRHKFINNYVKT